VSEIEDYLGTVPPDQRVALERVVDIARRTVPAAVDQPVPDDVVRDVVALRRAEIDRS
jgi:hypothetical protein